MRFRAGKEKEEVEVTYHGGCIACHTVDLGMSAPLAFCAGLAFAAQHNPKAIRENLCEQHQLFIVEAFGRTVSIVKPEDQK
jgi:mono/diheme cytochrome c family protein